MWEKTENKAKYIDFDFDKNENGVSRLRIKAYPPAAEVLLNVRESDKATSPWKWRKNISYNGADNGSVFALLEFQPPRGWLLESTRAIYNLAAGRPELTGLLDEWKNCCSTGISQLSRVLTAREDYNDGSGRRKKRFFYALCDPQDIRMREIIKGLGYQWNPNRRMFELYAMPSEGEASCDVFANYNRGDKSFKYKYDDMYKVYPFLKREQRESIEFLLDKWAEGWHGALCADDMGIGKTLTALTVGKVAIENGFAQRIIVIANVPNIANWIDEWNNRVNGGRIAMKLTGDLFTRVRYKRDSEALTRDLSEAELIVANYEIIARNKRARDALYAVAAESPVITVFDEATKCANKESENYKAAFTLSMLSKFSIGLTGTPLSKEIYEAWCIFRLLDPAIYPHNDFMTNHRRDKEIWGWNARTKSPKKIVTSEYHEPVLFFSRVKDHFIRHEKNIQEMSATKEERTFILPKTVSAIEISLADKIRGETETAMRESIDWEALKKEGGGRMPMWQVNTLGYIQTMLDDPYIIYSSELFKQIDKDVKSLMDSGVKDRESALKRVFSPRGDELPYNEEQKIIYKLMDKEDKEALSLYEPAKLRYLKHSLKEGKDAHTIIFFTSSRCCERTANRLVEFFKKNAQKAGLGEEGQAGTNERPDCTQVFTIMGSTPRQKRIDTTEAFKNSPSAVLCCTDAMAYGCNLQFSDRLIHYNLPWSASVWKQRSDRIFRMGAEGIKEINYLLLDHPLEKRKVEVMTRNLETIRRGMGIEMSALPVERLVPLSEIEEPEDSEEEACFAR